MLVYSLIFIALFGLEFLYIKLAEVNNIKDIPNNRSAHRETTVRGGGIVIILSLFIYALLNYPLHNHTSILIIGSTIVAIISFIDDMITVFSKIRILVHIAALSLIFTATLIPETISFSQLISIAFLFIFSLAIINIYNFMDGINGITFLNTLVSYLTLYYINENYLMFTDSEVLIYLLLAIVVFGFFNFRKKAICFCGDIGSITIGFSLLFFVLLFYSKTHNPILFLLFSVYLVDGGFTILRRLFNKENIFKAHNKHLYQKLTNEKKINHLIISSIYFTFQLAINILIIASLIYNVNEYIVYFVFVLYIIIYFIIIKKINFIKT